MVNLPYLIFGIDPGNTVGIAAVDFSGKKVATLSFAHGGLSEATSAIEKIGTPSLISCDVTPLPDFVQKIAASFNARIWFPQHSIREEEKRQVARQYSLESSSAHERDALTAAVYAYREHQNRLRQIDLLPDFSKEEREHLSHMVLNGFTLRRAIISLTQKQERKEEEKPFQRALQQKLSPSQLESQLQKSLSDISRLSHENSNLRKALDFASGQLSSLQHKMKLLENGVFERMKRDSEVRKLRYENGRLRSLIEKISEFRKRKRDDPQSPKKGGKAQDSTSGLNSLTEKELNLESLVEEYRSKRRS